MTALTRDAVLGFIGGSGIYEIDGLSNTRWETMSSPFGTPSDQLLFGELDGQKLVFLPRHGRGHKLNPSGINYRANIDVMKRAGVTDIISLSAVGSLKEEYAPGHFVLIDQFIDRTFAREKSFYTDGCAAHVSFSHPVSERIQAALAEACKQLSLPYSVNGTYICMEGPQFSTFAESTLYRSWGCDVVGMTNMPEAKLAREAEIPYATVAMITDYDCWHPEHDSVTVEQVIKVLTGNAEKARDLVRTVAPMLAKRPEVDEQGGDNALQYALITHPEARDPELVAKLDAVAGRVLGG
ncbi:S-methyl-5'-thioadenosine phosphorylase [Nisaea denitrificans]|uniref:S-methyl-5'-thioadenosine phosphorylase n=1 Tax=Nisaea denitrificans TaxID=390877 RepID=UPI0004283443|nr:S-methyl-5'-thioadenosine phosphorylase [Nisaea denitrificans]